MKDDFSTEIYAIGLVSSDSIYQLILLLNYSFGLALKISHPITIEKYANDQAFARALHDDEDELKVQLIKNKNDGLIVFKNQSSIDFILFLTGKNAKSLFDKILQNSKSFKNISILSPIDPKKLKNLNVFIT